MRRMWLFLDMGCIRRLMAFLRALHLDGTLDYGHMGFRLTNKFYL